MTQYGELSADDQLAFVLLSASHSEILQTKNWYSGAQRGHQKQVTQPMLHSRRAAESGFLAVGCCLSEKENMINTGENAVRWIGD